jgi:tetratricopeptide (TPR) repeat protein
VALEAARAATQVIDKTSEDLITVRSDNLPLAGEVPFDRREFNKSILGLRKKYRFEKKELSFKIAKILALRGDKREAVLTLKGGVEDVLLEADEASKKLEADMRCYLGLLYEEMGQSLLALREFRRVLKDFQPNHAEAQRGVERLRKQAGDRASN